MMNNATRSAISGVIAAVIYLIIATVTGGFSRTAALYAGLLGLITFAIAFLISSVITARKTAK